MNCVTYKKKRTEKHAWIEEKKLYFLNEYTYLNSFDSYLIHQAI